MSSNDVVWDKKKCLLLIDTFKSAPILWDVKNEEFYNRQLKEQAWKCVANTLDIDTSYVKQKITNLLGSYRRERSKEKRSLTSKSTTKVYTSKWFAYKKMHFLANRYGRPKLSNVKIEIDDSEYENENQPVTDILLIEPIQADDLTKERIQQLAPKTRLRPQSTTEIPTKRQNFQNNADTSQSTLTQDLQLFRDTSNDPYISYAIHIAQELRKYDSITLSCVKHSISNILFEADMGQLLEKYIVENNLIKDGRVRQHSDNSDKSDSVNSDKQEEDDENTSN